MRVWVESTLDLIDFLHLIKRVEDKAWQEMVEEMIENVIMFRKTFNGIVDKYEIRIVYAHDILPVREIEILAHINDEFGKTTIDVEEWVEKVAGDP